MDNLVSNEKACLYVVATPIGNLGDIGQRAVETLGAVDVIAAEDTRHTGRLLRHLGISRPLVALHEHNERERLDNILQRLGQGQQVALVSDAGTPLISDPGYPLVRACHEAGFRVIPIPGPSALVAALCVSGLPTDQFVFRGFVPRREAARREFLATAASDAATQVLYESSHRILDTLGELCVQFGGGREMALCRELTKLHETVLRGSLESVLATLTQDENQRKGEFVLVVAGRPVQQASADQELERLLRLMLQEGVAVRQAAAVCSTLTGTKKNHAYRVALSLREEPGE